MQAVDEKVALFYHEPVLLEESLEYLLTDPEGVYVDCTLGGGGHSEAILKKLSSRGRLIAIDRDAEAIDHAAKRLIGYADRIDFVQKSFGEIDGIFKSLGISEVDGLLMDLGLSSRQIDAPGRGFGYMQNGPLDMRMDITAGGLTAAEVLNTYTEAELRQLFFDYGEENLSRRIAERIVFQRQSAPLTSTGELAEVVRSVVPPQWQIKSLARIFQAVRIEVNGEMDALRSLLIDSYRYLKTGGRVVAIVYHGLESRMIKRFFRGETPGFRKTNEAFGSRTYFFKTLTSGGLRASGSEVKKNPRSRSAVLRAVEKTGA